MLPPRLLGTWLRAGGSRGGALSQDTVLSAPFPCPPLGLHEHSVE